LKVWTASQWDTFNENKETWVARDVINHLNKVSHKPILLMNTGTYKEEYGDGSKRLAR